MIFILSALLAVIWILIISVVLLWISFKSPFYMVCIYIVISILPFLFQMTPQYDEEKWALIIGFGIRASDYILIVMLISILIKILYLKEWQNIKDYSIFILVLVFSLFLIVEILRNVYKYKIASFGEFRYTYITLILPVYIVYFFSSEEDRIRLFKFSIFTSLILTLLCIPIIGFLKNWNIHIILDPDKGRFLPSSLSLGLFYGLMGLIFGEKYGILKLSGNKKYLISSAAIFLIFIDGHRSVWLSVIVIFLILFLIRLKNERILLRRKLIVLTIIVVSIFLISSCSNISKFVSQRLIVFTNPELDPNANWRLLNWSFQIERFFHSPIIGEGFGSYWGFNIYKNDIWIMPHNLYIMILAKLGLVGLILYLFINGRIFIILKNSFRNYLNKNHNQAALVLLALICLIGANVYAIAYPIDPRYSWLFIGLGLAAVLNKEEDEI